jgi:hypothetical protein
VTGARLPWLAQPIPSAGFACHLPWNSPGSGSSAGLVQTDSARGSDNQEPGIRRRLFIMRLLDPLCLYSGSTLQEADKSLMNSHRSCEFPFHVKHYVRAELMALIFGGHSGRPVLRGRGAVRGFPNALNRKPRSHLMARGGCSPRPI